MSRPGHTLRWLDVDLLADTLERVMADRRASQQDVASATGLCKSTVSRMLGHRSPPSVDALLSLCAWMGMRVDRFARRAA